MIEPEMSAAEAVEILEGKNSFQHSKAGRHFKDALVLAINALRRESELLEACKAMVAHLDNYQTIDDSGSDALPKLLAAIAKADKQPGA